MSDPLLRSKMLRRFTTWQAATTTTYHHKAPSKINRPPKVVESTSYLFCTDQHTVRLSRRVKHSPIHIVSAGSLQDRVDARLPVCMIRRGLFSPSDTAESEVRMPPVHSYSPTPCRECCSHWPVLGASRVQTLEQLVLIYSHVELCSLYSVATLEVQYGQSLGRHLK